MDSARDSAIHGVAAAGAGDLSCCGRGAQDLSGAAADRVSAAGRMQQKLLPEYRFQNSTVLRSTAQCSSSTGLQYTCTSTTTVVLVLDYRYSTASIPALVPPFYH